MSVRKSLLSAALALLTVSLLSASAHAGLKAVVFDIEPAGDPLSPSIKDRLKADGDLLKAQLREKGLTIVDTGPQAAKIKDNLPLSQCNGCDQDIAKALGADIEVATAVQPTSAAESALSGNIKDVATNRVIREGVVNIRGPNEAEWTHGIKFLVKERFFNSPLPNDPAALRKLVDSDAKAKE